MAAKFEACVECSQKCLLLHEEKKNSLPIISSFFKVMIARDCFRFLYLPPKFAATMSELVDQETFLEDSSGQQWKIKITKREGLLAFDPGWSHFSVDHGLKVGDFLVFHYIKGSYFVVRIYDKTGCEKLDFPCRRNQHKRARIDGHYQTKVGQCNSIDEGLMNVSASDVDLSQSQFEVNDMEKLHRLSDYASNVGIGNEEPVPAFGAKSVEEPLYMTSRVLGKTDGEERRSILDLVSFEKPKLDHSFDGSNKVIAGDRYPDGADIYLGSQSEALLVGCDPLAKEKVSKMLSSDASNFENMEQINDTEPMHKIETISYKGSCSNKISRQLLIESAKKSDKDGGDVSDMSTRLTKGCRQAEKRDHVQSVEQGLEANIIEGEPIENNPVAELNQRHTSPVDSCQFAQVKFAGTSETLALPITSGIQPCEKEVMSKIEPMEMIPGLCIDNEIIPEICGQKPACIENNSYASMNVRNNNHVGGILTVEEIVSRILPLDASGFIKEEIKNAEPMHNVEIVSDKGSCIGKISRQLLIESTEKADKDGGVSHMACWNAEKTAKTKSDREENTGKGEPIGNDPVALLQHKHTSFIDDCQIAQEKFAGPLETFGLTITIGVQNCISGQKVGSIERNMLSNMVVNDNDQFDGMVTVEAVDSSFTTPVAANISCSVRNDNRFFLELPACLPPSSSKRTRIESKVVFLLDPDMRSWPVLYHERSRFRILCSGWEAFSKANNIKVGDECVFYAKSECEAMYGVKIIRNQMKAHRTSSLGEINVFSMLKANPRPCMESKSSETK